MRLFAVAAVMAVAVPAFAQDDFKSLPPGPGRDVTVKVCSQCHSPELASQQRLDPQGWKDLVAQMANNGAQATDDEFAQITQYLSTTFPASGAPAAAGAAPAAPAAPGAAPATPGAAPTAPGAAPAAATPETAPAAPAAGTPVPTPPPAGQ